MRHEQGSGEVRANAEGDNSEPKAEPGPHDAVTQSLAAGGLQSGRLWREGTSRWLPDYR